MSTPVLRPVVTVTVDGVAVACSDGSIRLDSSVVPYGNGSLQIAATTEELIELLDPRNDIRAVVQGSDAATPTDVREFDLAVQTRRFDHEERRLTLDLATDEILLMTYAPLVTDTGARTHQASLRAVVNYVLGKIGASLAAGIVDVDVTAYWPVTNLIPNSWPRNNALPEWVVGYNGTLVGSTEMTSPIPPDGPYAVQWTAGSDASGISTLAVGSPSSYRVSPGRWYVFVFVVASGSSTTARAAMQWRSRNGEGTLNTVYGDPITSVNSEFRRTYVIAQAPAGAETVWPFIDTTGNTAGRAHFVASAMLYEGDLIVPYFNGNTTDDANYTYEWSDPEKPHESAARRIPVVERLPELFRWEPGVNAWRFLEPLTSSSGLRLFCDEQRVWRLIDPNTYEVPGRISIAAFNATAGSDSITISDPNLYCTGVVVRYRWRDESGIDREAFDTAGTPGKVLLWESDRPYPGPGAAAAMLFRRSGQGRAQDVTALVDWRAQPGSEVSISLDGTEDQVGRVRSVEFRLTEALMSVGTLALTEAASDTWLGWDADEAWQDVDALLEWEDA